MTLDSNTVAVLLAVFGTLNTALLVYQAVKLGRVHTAVDGTHAAAVEAAHNAGMVAGVLAVSQSPPAAPPGPSA